MAQFTLNWDNGNILTNENALSQRASYRPRTGDGPWITDGFTPTNDMDKSENTADTPDTLNDNIVYQFKVEAICEVGGPTINDNGVREGINFICLTPSLTHTYKHGDITLDVSGTDITKAEITLKKSSNNALIDRAIIDRVGDTIFMETPSPTRSPDIILSASSGYYWQVDLMADVNNEEVRSSRIDFIGSLCSPYPFTTDAPPVCDPITSADITSVAI